ncbi:hypothetical protein K439DRAFT_1619576 [Ramaria rubella]|nr:hypothetical protein K439DRAFT_1619576 [Ramaria rubella]
MIRLSAHRMNRPSSVSIVSNVSLADAVPWPIDRGQRPRPHPRSAGISGTVVDVIGALADMPNGNNRLIWAPFGEPFHSRWVRKPRHDLVAWKIFVEKWVVAPYHLLWINDGNVYWRTDFGVGPLFAPVVGSHHAVDALSFGSGQSIVMTRHDGTGHDLINDGPDAYLLWPPRLSQLSLTMEYLR